jgi:hypothetical protein
MAMNGTIALRTVSVDASSAHYAAGAAAAGDLLDAF